MIVCLGFCCAGYLINSSYSDWQESPVSTTIMTKLIADLDFPTVTVCPPKASHTALNYDLMKTDNSSLTTEDRENLKNETYKIFIELPHQEFVRHMVAVANPENMRQTFEGFQTVPRSIAGNRGFEIKMWNKQGTWQTPWFKEERQNNYYTEDKNYKVVLEFPEDLKEQIGAGSLVIQLKVDTRVKEGWQEEVVYWEGPKFKLHTKGKSWTEAEAHCQAEGGHLASVVSEGKQEEVMAEAGTMGYVWLGGSDQKEEGGWQWTDGSQWAYTNWEAGYGNKGDRKNCVMMPGIIVS